MKLNKDMNEFAWYRKSNTLVNKLSSRKLSDYKYSKLIARVVSVVILVSAGLSFWLSSIVYLEESSPTRTGDFAFISLMALLFGCSLLRGLIGNAYWFYTKSNKKEIDERQLYVRRRVYERSYVILGLIVIFGSVFGPSIIREVLVKYTETRQLMPYPITIAFLIYSIPLVIAAWQKDA